MTISIIIPVYNVAPYVEQCILSVMHQTMRHGVECIIVDDCGNDDSMDRVEKLIAGYDGDIEFSILHHDHNRGLSAARNTGIDAARGQYLYFLDSDDWIVPECLELMQERVNEHPDVEIVFAGATHSTGRYKWLDYTTKQLPEYTDDNDWLRTSMLRRFDLGMTVWNKLISREVINTNNLSFGKCLVHEDEIWNFQLSLCVHRAAFIARNTYHYNARKDSLTNAVTDDLLWERLFIVWDEMIELTRGSNSTDQIKAISSFVLEKTSHGFPRKHKMQLCRLFMRLAGKACNSLSVFLVIQGFLALCYPKRFNNYKICKRIKL